MQAYVRSALARMPSHLVCTMHGTMVARRLDGGSTEALARITFEVITFEPLRVVRTDFTGFQWQHRAARHEELIALAKP